MDIKKIEDFYNKGKYREIIDIYNDEKDINLHVKRLIIRAHNKLSQPINNLFENDNDIKDDIDYKFNTIMLCNNDYDKNVMYNLLKDILYDGREDLLEDFVILFFEKFEHFPIFDKLMNYVIENKNRPIIRKYLSLIEDELNEKWQLIYAIVNNGDIDSIISKFDNKVMKQAADIFLKKKDLGIEDINAFLNCIKFQKGHFFIFNNDIYRIEDYNEERKEFIIYDKFSKKKTMKAEEIILKTKPIEDNDFRVYKYFSPEKAKSIDICSLLKSIIKYYGNAVDKKNLIKELTYIYQENAMSFYRKNKKTLSECNGIHVIFSKNERYMLSNDNENQILSYIKRLKDTVKIRDYIINIDSIDEGSKKEIIEYFDNKESFIVNEILYFLTNDNIYIEKSIQSDISEFKYDKFIAELIILKSKNNQLKEINFDNLKSNIIEYIYKGVNKTDKEKIIEKVNEALRLKIGTNILEWYCTYHIKDNLIHFPLKDTCMLYFEIADANAVKSKSDSFLSFVRKFFFTSANPFFIKLMDILEKDEFEELFNYFITTHILNAYQMDAIKIKVYKVFPELRTFKTIEYDYSTKKGIKLKEEELNNIIKKTLPELSQKIKEAASHGDLKENAEYKYAREQYAFYSSRAEELKEELSMIQPIDFSSIDKESVGIGNTVTLEDIKTKEKVTYTILGVFDSDFGDNIISYKSPLAKKMLNKKIGDVIEDKKIVNIDIYTEE